jgi:hypothetical protein
MAPTLLPYLLGVEDWVSHESWGLHGWGRFPTTARHTGTQILEIGQARQAGRQLTDRTQGVVLLCIPNALGWWGCLSHQ